MLRNVAHLQLGDGHAVVPVDFYVRAIEKIDCIRDVKYGGDD